MELISVILLTIFKGLILPRCFHIIVTAVGQPDIFTWTPLPVRTVFMQSSGWSLIVWGIPMALAVDILRFKTQEPIPVLVLFPTNR